MVRGRRLVGTDRPGPARRLGNSHDRRETDQPGWEFGVLRSFVHRLQVRPHSAGRPRCNSCHAVYWAALVGGSR